MSACLHYGKMWWAELTLELLSEILNALDKSNTGCLIECDLSFPEDIQQKLKDFPPAPESLTPDTEWLNEFSEDGRAC